MLQKSIRQMRCERMINESISAGLEENSLRRGMQIFDFYLRHYMNNISVFQWIFDTFSYLN